MTTTYPCSSNLILLDSTHQIRDELPAGIEHARFQALFQRTFEDSARCLAAQSPQCTNISKTFIDVLNMKKKALEAMRGLEALENTSTGMPIYDALAIKEMREGIEQLYIVALHACQPKLFTDMATKIVKLLETSKNGLLNLNNNWVRTNSANDTVLRYMKKNTADHHAAKLLLLNGVDRQYVAQLFKVTPK
jgi:plasmid maintenance system antidote protein VapI